MSKPFYQLSDPSLNLWATQAGGTLGDAAEAFHVLPAQAAELVARAAAFDAALVAWNDPATRTPIASAEKSARRAELLDYARYLMSSINANPLTTDAQREALGIRPRRRPTPVPAPASVPMIDLAVSGGRTITLRLHGDENRRGKPKGVKGASLFTFVGPAVPADMDAWKFEGLTTRTTVELDFSAVAGGQAATVWVTANWYNDRGQTGDACAPVSVNLPASAGARPAGSTGAAAGMKIAA